MYRYRKWLALLLALVLLCSFTACNKNPDPVEEESESEPEVSEQSKIYINGLLDYEFVPSNIPKYTKKVAEMVERNTDTVGWLDIPGTTINDVIVCNDDPQDYNNYYYRRNFEKAYSFAGVLYADFRTKFGSGRPEDLSNNITIYGHTLSADINGVMFAPLKYFTQEEFARETPYVYFSTLADDMAWEVFAVLYATVNLAYNRPDLSDSEFEAVMQECIDRSIYDYGIEITADDHVLTMSTCTYSVPGIGTVSYPNDYRYVVMARLVDKQDATKTEASFTVNPSPKAP